MFFKKLRLSPFSNKLNENIRIFNEGKTGYLAQIFCVFGETNNSAKQIAATFLLELLRKASFNEILKLSDNIRKMYYSQYYTFNWASIRISDLHTSTMTDDEKKAVLIFASFHANGYLREKAVNELTNYSGTLKYLYLRRNDWVQEVREAAKKSMQI